MLYFTNYFNDTCNSMKITLKEMDQFIHCSLLNTDKKNVKFEMLVCVWKCF
jgi:hypothetical protein